MQLLRKLPFLLFITLVFIGGCSRSALSGPPVVTKAEADQVKVGMTLGEAQKIVGDPGEAPPETGGDAKLAAAPTPHVWTNPDGSGLTVTVLNGKIQQVSPMNLK